MTAKTAAKGEAFVNKRFPNGRFYMSLDSCPEIRFCIGLGGNCGISLADEQTDPLCPGCRCQSNLSLCVASLKLKAEAIHG